MNEQSALAFDTGNDTATARLYQAPPNWDSLVARSRRTLPALCRAVVSEVTKAPGCNGFLRDDTGLLGRSLRILVQAYAIGILSSVEIESTVLSGPESFSVTFNLAPSAADLRNFRRRHRALVVHCLARVYWLAWATHENDSPSGSESYVEGTEWESDRWPHALKEAHNRLEWATFVDQVERD
jgi:hypothetical protein